MYYASSKIIGSVCLLLFAHTIGAQTHPSLISKARIAELAAGNSEWTTLKKSCDDNLNVLIGADYAGWGWRDATVNYSTAYQVLKTSDATTANKYAAKALALMKVLARHHNYGGPGATAQLLGLGDGTNKTFTLPFAPMSGTTVSLIKVPVTDTAIVYSGATVVLSSFEPIIKISTSKGGNAAYSASDYKLYYRDGTTIFVLRWLTANHPANGATYYVTMSSGTGSAITKEQFTVSGTNVTLATAPSSTEAVFASFLGSDYEQTGNFLGGMSSVTPDGPGYQMRTFNPGLAFGFDLLYDYPGFTTALKTEFVDILNRQIDWYRSYGYERDGDLGNYFIRGLLTGAMFTAYGTDGANSRSAELKKLADSCIYRPFTKLDQKLPGGFGPQGQYANGVASDILQVFSLYKDLTGQDLLSKLEWTSAIIPATIHGTKPDRKTFYDGGDWSDLPATPLTGLVGSFLTYLPDHPMAPYARQLLKDIGEKVPAGTITDYKTTFPQAYFANVSGPIYARSDWSENAVWVSLSAEEVFMDHQGLDQGHFTIQRGTDYLVCDGGGYGDLSTTFHNTLLFDDRGAGNLITYPPGQGYWGFDHVGIRKFEQTDSYVYGLADFTQAYAQASEGKQNSVKMAVRSMVYIRPGIVIVHDRAQTFKPEVKKYFNCNFSAAPAIDGGVVTATMGSSKIFMKTLMPAGVSPVISAIEKQPIAKSNLQELISGEQNSNFLHVFNATATTQSTMLPAALVNAASAEGAEVTAGDTTWVTLFAKTDSVLASSVVYTYASKGRHCDLITDLQKNMQYTVSVSSGGKSVLSDTIFASSDNGTVFIPYSALDSGTVTLTANGISSIHHRCYYHLTTDRFTINQVPGNASISFDLVTPQHVQVLLFAMNGRIIAGTMQRAMDSGTHTLMLRGAKPLPAGTYLVRVKLGSSTHTRTIVIAR